MSKRTFDQTGLEAYTGVVDGSAVDGARPKSVTRDSRPPTSMTGTTRKVSEATSDWSQVLQDMLSVKPSSIRPLRRGRALPAAIETSPHQALITRDSGPSTHSADDQRPITVASLLPPHELRQLSEDSPLRWLDLTDHTCVFGTVEGSTIPRLAGFWWGTETPSMPQTIYEVQSCGENLTADSAIARKAELANKVRDILQNTMPSSSGTVTALNQNDLLTLHRILAHQVNEGGSRLPSNMSIVPLWESRSAYLSSFGDVPHQQRNDGSWVVSWPCIREGKPVIHRDIGRKEGS